MTNENKSKQEEATSPSAPVPNPIGEAINRFLHRTRDIKFSCRVFIPAAGMIMRKRIDEAKEKVETAKSLMLSDDEVEKIHGMKLLQGSIRDIERIEYSEVPEILKTSLFLSLFSTFDTYTGDLLTALYGRRPELFSKLNHKVELADVLTAKSIEELKKSVLEEEIETFRRKSYLDQFSELESTFGLQLKKFDRWPEFVECTQRRNLMTHCGGIVSEQYRKICQKEGYPKSEIPPVGEKLKLAPKYLFPACELMMEVGLKLGQTLWRKVLPDEVEAADKHLHQAQYDALFLQNWARAIRFGEFAVSQKSVSSELQKRLAIINYCIALKFGGKDDECKSQLATMDWSACTNDFRIAEAVLQDRFKDASGIMIKIGKTGEIVSEHSYHSWPLFHIFREKPEFMEAYEKVYGHPFIAELKRNADNVLTEASIQVDKNNNGSSQNDPVVEQLIQ